MIARQIHDRQKDRQTVNRDMDMIDDRQRDTDVKQKTT